MRKAPRRLVAATTFDRSAYATTYLLECGHAVTVVWREPFSPLRWIRALGSDPMKGFLPTQTGESREGFSLRCVACAQEAG